MPDDARDATSRRAFLGSAGWRAAHIARAAPFAPSALRAAWTAKRFGTVVAREPWGKLEKVADGVWALISAPLSGDRTTLSNGGIIAGRNGVMAVEGFFTSQGARWMASQARQLTGRWPTHVVLTHYHSDHANGVDGFMAEGFPTRVLATAATRDQVLRKNTPLDDSRSAALKDVVTLSATSETVVDLGGRSVRIVPRAGHTSSDVSVELDDPSLVFAGDLLWNAMIPNFVDAVPTLPASLGEWALFGPTFYERAFIAWNRELGAKQ